MKLFLKFTLHFLHTITFSFKTSKFLDAACKYRLASVGLHGDVDIQ